MLFFKGREIRGVIFDIDGTLMDSLSFYYTFFNKGLAGVGMPPVSRDLLFKYLGSGISLKDILRKVIPGDRDNHFVENLAKDILNQFVEVDMDMQLFPGVKEILKFLRNENIKIGLATGRVSGAAYEWDRLRKIGVDGFVDAIVTASEVGNRKPAPDLITECAREMNVSVKKCLVVGDAVSDILAARGAGAIPAAVSTGVEDRDILNKEKPEAILETLDELMVLLKKSS